MDFVQKSVINEDEVDTILNNDITFSGILEAESDLLIKGNFSGRLICHDELYISPEAVVDAEIDALSISCRGTLKGTARAKQSIRILAGSNVSARLEAPDVVIEDKDCFRGTIVEPTAPQEIQKQE